VPISRSGFDVTPLTPEQVAALAANLSPEERRVILDAGTEHAFCGTLLDNKKNGVYRCRLCELPLFASDAKFDSGTGWPSFSRPFDPDHVALVADHEARCARCGAHLGHLFGDGPAPSRLRFCVNSIALVFEEQV
jgi:peptide-methionine (R)-S-oxide reductase